MTGQWRDPPSGVAMGDVTALALADVPGLTSARCDVDCGAAERALGSGVLRSGDALEEGD